MKVNAVIFDMDGVIFDTERVANLSWKMAEKEFGVTTSEEFLHSLLGINLQDAYPFFKQYIGDVDLGLRIYEWRRKWLNEYYAKEGVPLKPGVREIFAYLKEAGIPGALATSSTRAMVDNYFRWSQLECPFEVILTGEMLSNGKPHPEIFLKAAQALKKDIHACLVIEDSIKGMQGGIASGAMTVMVPDLVQPTEEIREKAFSIQKSLLDVIALIKKLNRGEEKSG